MGVVEAPVFSGVLSLCLWPMAHPYIPINVYEGSHSCLEDYQYDMNTISKYEGPALMSRCEGAAEAVWEVSFLLPARTSRRSSNAAEVSTGVTPF